MTTKTYIISEEVLRQVLETLEEFDALIAYQYTGSQEAMSALQYAVDRGVEALAACKDV